MTNILAKLKNLSIITIVASFVIGLVLVIKPSETLQFVSLLTGATMILLGISAWIYYFVKDKAMFMAVLGSIAIMSGIIVCVKYKSIISFMLILFGGFLIVSGIVDLISAIDIKKSGVFGWLVPVIMSLAIIVVGIIIIVNPFGSIELITRILGAGLLAYAVMDLIAFVQIRRVVALKTVVDKDVTEIDITHDDIE